MCCRNILYISCTSLLYSKHRRIYKPTLKTNFGVPQASTFAPLFFNIFVNDLGFFALKCRLFQYADDTMLIFSHWKQWGCSEAASIFQGDVNVLTEWFLQSHIFLNNNNAKLRCIWNSHKQIKLNRPIVPHKLHGKVTESVGPMKNELSTKYLGLVLDERFAWSQHVKYIVQKLHVSAYLYKMRTMNVNFKLKVYNPLAESMLRLGVTIYGFCSSTKRDGMDRVRNRIVTNIAYGSLEQDLYIEKKRWKLNVYIFWEATVLCNIVLSTTITNLE